jgi:hypothetical protein
MARMIVTEENKKEAQELAGSKIFPKIKFYPPQSTGEDKAKKSYGIDISEKAKPMYNEILYGHKDGCSEITEDAAYKQSIANWSEYKVGTLVVLFDEYVPIEFSALSLMKDFEDDFRFTKI